MATLRTGPVIGLIAQVALLTALAMTTGLGAAGWLTGIAYGLVTCYVLSRGLHRSGAVALGPADRVTLTRATLVGGVAALVVDRLGGPTPVAVLVALAGVALALDAVDGKVARRTGTVSALGARFDMEVDAFLILVLSVHLVPVTGAWVLAIGAMRYAFVAATWALPWMGGPLPPRFWRKVVAAVQGVVLVVASSGVLPRPLTVAVVAGSLALLAESFGRDVAWRWRARPVPAVRRAGVAVPPLAAAEPLPVPAPQPAALPALTGAARRPAGSARYTHLLSYDHQYARSLVTTAESDRRG